MNLKTYISAGRGRLTVLSKAIGAHRPDVSRWASGERPVPVRYGLAIEEATGGLVTRREMFSAEVLRNVWPELVGAGSVLPDEIDSSDDVQPPAGTADRKEGE
ncbi:TPA: helix-turn-helix domain-containing protein [Burkholderia vietnamiensis]|nr:helix-turn-helix domain-containing protein [Burkholderia vietnamiensis]